MCSKKIKVPNFQKSNFPKFRIFTPPQKNAQFSTLKGSNFSKYQHLHNRISMIPRGQHFKVFKFPNYKLSKANNPKDSSWAFLRFSKVILYI